MKVYLGVTDTRWYQFLAGLQPAPMDINFWQPGGNGAFKVLAPNEPFLFKLKAPLNAIGGVGFFSRQILLPLSMAWETFGVRNGTESLSVFKRMIQDYRRNGNEPNPTIGCIILNNPIFFARQDWIPLPADWKNPIQKGKGYEVQSEVGADIWRQVLERLDRYLPPVGDFKREEASWLAGPTSLVNEDAPLYGKSYLQRLRIGQGAFRMDVTTAYNGRCTITGEKTLPALEAAHIKAYSESGPNIIPNGLLLRSDMHKLFDSGYLTLTTDYKVEVSNRIKEEFQNGREYYQYHGKPLASMPNNPIYLPEKKFIDWHNQNVYNG